MVKLPGRDVREEQIYGVRDMDLIKDSLILNFPVSDTILDEFSLSLPVIHVDGEQFNLGEVQFRRASETWYIINC